MDSHAIEYYTPYSEESSYSHFHAVIALHENLDLRWQEALKISPRLSRGWYELAHLSKEDRIDFTKEFWLSKLPYYPGCTEFLGKFFGSLDDIGIFLTQQKYDDAFEPQFVYSRANNGGFFHGEAAATEAEIGILQKQFQDYLLPKDYLAFLQIHNGFSKLTDTGILKINEMEENYQNFQTMLEEGEPLILSESNTVNPHSLIPFYKSFGMPFYQCFWGEWYPDQEMGNVYYSNLTNTISDCKKPDCRVETMAFETFTDWLTFYLDTVD